MMLYPFPALTTAEIIIAVFAAPLLLIAGYLFGKLLSGIRHGRARRADKDMMFDVEKALKEFWEHDRRKLENEKAGLAKRIEVQEKQIEEYRKKAAGVGLMGMGKDRKADLLLGLLLENEQLEEKLFEMNLRMKEDRDRMLERELEHVSHKKVLLSAVLADAGVQEKVKAFLADKGNVEKIDIRELPKPGAGDENDNGDEEA